MLIAISTTLYAQSITYTYDNLGRLINATYPDSNIISYTYDAMGNRTVMKVINPCAIRPNPVISSNGHVNLCQGENVVLSSTLANHYLWSTGDTTASIMINKSGKYTVTTIGTLECIKISDTVAINVYPLPDIKSDANQKVCVGSSVSLGDSAIPGYAYSWSSKPIGYSSTLSNPTFRPINATTFYLTETIIATGCSAADSSIITTIPSPTVHVGVPKSVCSGSSVKIGSAPVNGDSYSWTSNPSGFNSTNSAPVVSPTAPTYYYLTETNSYGCSGIDSVLVSLYPSPLANWTTTMQKCELTFLPNITNYKTYLWHFGDGDSTDQFGPVHDYLSKGNFKVILKTSNADDCSSEHDSIISINELCSSGINEVKIENTGLSVYPDPFSLNTELDYQLTKSSKVTIYLYDVTGRKRGVIVNETQPSGTYKYGISTEIYHLEPGMYYLDFIVDGESERKSIVKL